MTDRKINDAVTGVVRYAGFHSGIQSNTLLQKSNCDICLEELLKEFILKVLQFQSVSVGALG